MKSAKIAAALTLMLGLVGPALIATKANACTNSYDSASDGSRCGGRASGCKAGGRGGYC